MIFKNLVQMAKPEYWEEDPDQYLCKCGAEKAWDDESCPQCLQLNRSDDTHEGRDE